MRKILISLFVYAYFFFLISLSAFSQNDSLIFYPVNNPVIQQYDLRQITAAKDGKLWLSTGNGLLSYDGNDVHVFLPKENDSTSLSGHSISRTFLDDKGNLFVVAIADEQINYFNTTTGKATRFKIKISSEDSSGYLFPYPYWCICTANNNTILAGRSNMGFIQYDLVTKKAINYSLLSALNPKHNNVYTIRRDIRNSDLFWMATDDGIYSFNQKTNKLQKKFLCSNIKDSTDVDVDLRDLDVTDSDTIWFIDHIRGFGCYDIKTGYYTIFPYKVKKTGKEEKLFTWNHQRISPNQYLLLAAEHTPCIFNTTTHQYFFNSKMETEFPSVESNQTFIDSLGNVWYVAYDNLYVAKQKKNKFTSVAIQDKYYNNQYTDIFKTVIWDDIKNVYYVAFHMSDGIYVFDKNMKLIRSIPGPPFNNPNWGLVECFVVDIGLDKNRKLWMCGDVVSIYDSAKQKMIPVNTLYPNLKCLHQRFRNLVFRKDFLYALPARAASKYLYRINVDKLTCDSILLSDIPLEEDQAPAQLGPLEMDSSGENAYIGNKDVVFQYNLITRKMREIIELAHQDRGYAHVSNFHWYNVDDNDNLWVSSLGKIWIFEPNKLHLIKTIEKDTNTYFIQAYNIKGKGIMYYSNSTSNDLYDYNNWKHYKLGKNDGLITYDNGGVACVNNMLFVGSDNYFQYLPLSSIIDEKKERKCHLSEIRLFNVPYLTDTLPEYLHSLSLPHDKNFVTLTFSSTEFEQPQLLEYRYRLEGVDKNWVYTNYLGRTISYPGLKPGNYIFYTGIRNRDGSWNDNKVNLHITILPAWWQTNLFTILCIIGASVLAFVLIRWRINTVRKQEQQKARTEKEMLELEAKALRAQMNPHFIFNCMNSIKSLIQQDEKEKATTYLTTFSKLIRTIFQNSDKREITLFDEIETCRLYTQLEGMRFGDRLSYSFDVDEIIDLKSIMVPALILQPFIENAIWHGIMPKEEGGTIHITISKKEDKIFCIVEDDGIGREVSMQKNLNGSPSAHQSKGVRLTQTRLEISNVLNRRNANIGIIDKRNAKDEPTGTKVVLAFTEE
jgi:ligand-binding sensor domain-containing protein/two-component sensor histidine kinase